MLAPVQRGELSNRLRRFFGIVGDYVPQLESVINPVALAVDLQEPPYRQSTIGFQSQTSVAAVAGSIGAIEIRNTVGTAPAIIDEIVARASAMTAVCDFYLRLGGFQAFTAQVENTFNTDGIVLQALPAPGTTPPLLFAGTTVAGPFVGSVVASGQHVVAGMVRFRGPIVLNPGQGLTINAGVANLALAVSFRGRIFMDPALSIPQL